MSHEPLIQLEMALFGSWEEPSEQTVTYQPKIEAERVDDGTIRWYRNLIGERVHKLPQFVGSVSNRLKGYASIFGNRLRNLVYKVKKEEPHIGGYFLPVTEETVYNARTAESNPKFARHSVTHEMIHLLQKVTGAIKRYAETLSDHYSKLYGKLGEQMESYGAGGMRNFMEIYGRMVGLQRARVALEGNASDLTAWKEGESSDDAYVKAGWTHAMRKAREHLGTGVVTAPQTKKEVLAVDGYIDRIPAFAYAYA